LRAAPGVSLSATSTPRPSRRPRCGPSPGPRAD